MHVGDGLPGLCTCVEDDPVSAIGYALGYRYLVSMRDDIGEEPLTSGRQLGQGRVMIARDHEDMDWSLRIDVTECNRARIARHDSRRYLGGGNATEQAVGHWQILTCTGPTAPPTYMVAVLRTHGAPPPGCSGPASFWPSVAQG